MAIQAYFVKGITIEHNEILHVPYSGISVGWGWATRLSSQTCKQNIIRYNKIGVFNAHGRDGGGIYTLGQQPNSICSNNYLYNQIEEFAAMYFDEGTSGYTVSNNVIRNCKQWLYIWTSTINNINVNNNYTSTSNFTNKGTNISLTNTNIINESSMPQVAIDIINASGLEKTVDNTFIPNNNGNQAATISGVNSTYTIDLGQTLLLEPKVDDDKKPIDFIETHWEQISGPTPITFSNLTRGTNTNLSFSTAGTYNIKFSVSDGDLTSTKNIVISVSPKNIGTNLALNKPTKSSSIWDTSLSQDKAVDGNISTIWHPSSTDANDFSWWQVDLGQAIKTNRFEIVTRQSNPQAATRRYFQIIGSNDPTFATYEPIAGQAFDTLAYQGTWVANINSPQGFQHYRVRKMTKTGNTIAEFRVFTSESIVTGMNEEDDKDNFTLEVYPNPTMNKCITAKFTVNNIAITKQTTLELYDLQGRKIQTLFEGQQRGEQIVNSNFSSVKAGTYLLLLSSNGQRISKKILVL